MKYCEKCLAKNGNFDFFVMTFQMSCGAFRQRERVTLQTSCGAERDNLPPTPTLKRFIREAESSLKVMTKTESACFFPTPQPHQASYFKVCESNWGKSLSLGHPLPTLTNKPLGELHKLQVSLSASEFHQLQTQTARDMLGASWLECEWCP